MATTLAGRPLPLTINSTSVPTFEKIGRDITHGDRPADGRPVAAARDRADDLASADDLRAFARRCLAFRQQADALPRHAIRDLAENDLRAGKIGLFAPPLADDPAERRLDRCRRLVDVVAVEAKPGLETQRVARAEPDGLHLRFAEELLRQRDRILLRHGNLVAVLARIARAADETGNAGDVHRLRRHEDHLGGGRRETRENLDRLRPLQRDQRPVRNRLQRNAGRQVRRDMREVRFLAGRVDDDEIEFARAGSAGRVTIRSSRIPPFSFSSSV